MKNIKRIVYFNNTNDETDNCSGQKYIDFLDYAFKESDYFMLVYINYYGKGYTKTMKDFRNKLKPYKVKSRCNPKWPGVMETYCKDTTYKIVFYRNVPQAKEVLCMVNKMSDWSQPSHPVDLAFFKGNQCWFYSVGHEKIAGIIHASENDIDFVLSKGLATMDDIFPYDSYYDAYDEVLE